MPGSSEIRAELAQVLASNDFRKAHRQSELLAYIIEASLADRKKDLIGKNIAENVFEIDPTSPRDMSTVRVEIGRLRRRLRRYYAEEGASNPVRIDIPTGGYAPKFTSASTTLPLEQKPASRSIWFLTFAVLVIAIAGLSLYILDGRSVSNDRDRLFTENLEASSMFREARNVSNPPIIKARVQSAISLAQEIQHIDPDFAGGYAAESLQLWNFVIFDHSDTPEADIARAVELARKAIETDPEFSWGHHALAQALHLNKNVVAGIEAARRAVDLDPEEPDHHGYLGLLIAVSQKGADSQQHINDAITLSDSVRGPYLNFLGIAHFHDRQFEEAAEVIRRNRDRGGPSGPHMYLFLAAANALAGHEGRAAAFASMIRNDDSGFVPINFIDRLYEVPEERALMIDGLSEAGLSIAELM